MKKESIIKDGLIIFTVMLLSGLTCYALGWWAKTESGVPQASIGNPPAGDGLGQVCVEPSLFPTQAPQTLITTDLYLEAIEYAWDRESSRGTDPNWRVMGPAGEQGQLRQTPIFIEDVFRISGEVIDSLDLERARYGMFIYLQEYAPKVGAVTVEDLYELYRRGYKGYKTWKRN